MPEKDSTPINGLRKAAILMVILGEDAASEIYRHLPSTEMGQVTKELASLQRVDSETSLTVLEEFNLLVLSGGYVQQGGTTYANKILVKSVWRGGSGRSAAPGRPVGGEQWRQTRFSAQGRSQAIGEVH